MTTYTRTNYDATLARVDFGTRNGRPTLVDHHKSDDLADLLDQAHAEALAMNVPTVSLTKASPVTMCAGDGVPTSNDSLPMTGTLRNLRSNNLLTMQRCAEWTSRVFATTQAR